MDENRINITVDQLTDLLLYISKDLCDLVGLPDGIQMNVVGTTSKGRKLHIMLEVLDDDD